MSLVSWFGFLANMAAALDVISGDYLFDVQRNIALRFGLVEQRFVVIGKEIHRNQTVLSPTKVRDVPLRDPRGEAVAYARPSDAVSRAGRA